MPSDTPSHACRCGAPPDSSVSSPRSPSSQVRSRSPVPPPLRSKQPRRLPTLSVWPEREDLRSEHVDERDQGDRRRDRRASRSRTSSARSVTHCCSSPARTGLPPLPSTSRSATTPRSPASAARRTTSPSTARSMSYNQCFGPGDCTALVNFWRSLSNLTINVAGKGGCQSGEFWATSQAASMRRVHVNGAHHADGLLLAARPSPAAASSPTRSSPAPSSTARSSSTWSGTAVVAGWSNGVWNQVFAGVDGAPAQSFPNPPYTTLDTNPQSREKPFLYVDANDQLQRLRARRAVRLARHDVGRTARRRATRSRSSDFFIAKPSDSVQAINNALAAGQEPHLHPGHLQRRPDDQGEARATRSCSDSGWRRSKRRTASCR